MTDSIRGGYRTATIRLKFDPDFKWQVSRNEAIAAKGKEESLFFRVHFSVDMSQANFSAQSTLKIIPRDIALVDKAGKHVFWATRIIVQEKERVFKEEKKEKPKEKFEEDLKKETVPDKQLVE
jgi:hypothetical protein